MKTDTIADIQLFAGEEAAADSGMSGNDAAEGQETAVEENAAPEKEADAPLKAAEEKKEALSDTGLLNAVRAALEESEKSRQINGVIDRWKKDAEELKSVYPGFDPGKELCKPEMEQLLTAGVPLRRAYEVVNLEKIIGSAMRYASLNAGKRTADALMMHKSRPQENGVLDRASSVKRTDVRSLTEKDIIRILGEVSRGAKISFN